MLYFPLVFNLFSISFSICGASNPFQVETHHGVVEGSVWTRLTVQALAAATVNHTEQCGRSSQTFLASQGGPLFAE